MSAPADARKRSGNFLNNVILENMVKVFKRVFEKPRLKKRKDSVCGSGEWKPDLRHERPCCEGNNERRVQFRKYLRTREGAATRVVEHFRGTDKGAGSDEK